MKIKVDKKEYEELLNRVDSEIEAICEYLGVEIVTDMKGQKKCIKKGEKSQ